MSTPKEKPVDRIDDADGYMCDRCGNHMPQGASCWGDGPDYWTGESNTWCAVCQCVEEKRSQEQDKYIAAIMSTPDEDSLAGRWPTKREVNADLIAQIISEDARVEDGKVANVGYLAVKIAEMIERL